MSLKIEATDVAKSIEELLVKISELRGYL